MEERILFTLVGMVISGAGFYVSFKVQLAVIQEKITYLSKQQSDIIKKIFGNKAD